MSTGYCKMRTLRWRRHWSGHWAKDVRIWPVPRVDRRCWKQRLKKAARGGSSGAALFRYPPQTIGPWARGFGSTRISTVTYVATTVVCVPRPWLTGPLIAEIVVLVGEHARATMVWALHAYILLGLRRATRPSMQAPRRLATGW